MKISAVILGMLLTAAMLLANPQKMPPILGKSGPQIAVFHGGRPRMGNILSELLQKGKCRAINVNGAYLDGYCGTTIKINMTDKVEPVPFDGVTPVLKDLSKVDLVLFQGIPAEQMEKMLTSERIAQLRSYVENGGHILFTLKCPTAIGDLLPLQMEKQLPVKETLYANRPEGEAYALIPDKIPVYRAYHPGHAEKDATVMSVIRDEKGNEVAPFLVRKSIGKGTVTFLNAEIAYANQLREFANWAYAKAFLFAVIGDSGRFAVNPDIFIEKMQPIPERKQIDEVTVDINAPILVVTECTKSPVVTGRQITFGNGCVIAVTDNGNVTISYPECAEPLIRNYKIPEIGFSEERSFFDAATAEATDGEANFKAADIKWQLRDITAEKNAAVLTYTAKNSEMRWCFTAGTLNLDGRKFTGIADRIEVPKCPLRLNEIVFKSELTPKEPLFARRNSCYSPPRGYVEFDMSGKTKADTYTWRYFGSGQPFELLVCKDGVYMGNVEDSQAVIVRFTRQKGAPAIANLRRHTLGRIFAPCATARYWHWYSQGAERGHNDYLAMYQYVRKDLRRRAGLKELPPYPICSYTHQITNKEGAIVREAARKAGYRFISHPGCEQPADVSYSPKRFALFNECIQKGTGSRIWTAGSYVQGDGGWIYNNHPEWFVRDSKGKIFAYGNGRYPVIDVNEPEYFKWYCSIAKPAIDAGVRWVYRDMDGAAANCINYGKKESPHGMEAQIRFYRFFHENNCRVAIEGMNPLVIDEYWYRPALYTQFTGNEFCLVGSVPVANFYEGLELDLFRTGMYGCFPVTELSGYTFRFERIKDELVRADRMVSLVPKFNEALDNTGMPFVRETEFGTTWIGEKGGALFFWNPTRKVTVNLPSGWKIKGVNGNVLTDVKADAIYLLEK